MKGITQKSKNISSWYNEVILAAKLAEHGPARGTMILRPLGFAIWEAIQKHLDIKIRGLGAKSVYFPLFIPYSLLQKEKSHIEGFSPELAVVTHGGGEKLAEPLVIRPTSETIMYDAFSRWIRSYRDLPLIINQWVNVVRWEKRPYLFLRTTEFLWQEGHSAHRSGQKAQKMVEEALKMYVDFYQDTLGLYGFAGKKSESEKFAGANETYTYEMLMPDGKILQGCTSHNLGQNFSRVFEVEFQDEDGKRRYVWQTSWGLSTRSLGGLILVHGDNHGLVLPPAIAPLQVVIIPITSKGRDNKKITGLVQKAFEILEEYNIITKIDDGDQTPGWKFNQYDLEGVPLRVEIGEKEIKEKKVTVVRRDNKEAMEVSLEKLGTRAEEILGAIQKDLLSGSKKFTLENTREAKSYDEFKEIMRTVKGFIKAFWCEGKVCETKIKEETKATTRCLPQDATESRGRCIYCGQKAKFQWLFGQAY